MGIQPPQLSRMEAILSCNLNLPLGQEGGWMLEFSFALLHGSKYRDLSGENG